MAFYYRIVFVQKLIWKVTSAEVQETSENEVKAGNAIQLIHVGSYSTKFGKEETNRQQRLLVEIFPNICWIYVNSHSNGCIIEPAFRSFLAPARKTMLFVSWLCVNFILQVRSSEDKCFRKPRQFQFDFVSVSFLSSDVSQNVEIKQGLRIDLFFLKCFCRSIRNRTMSAIWLLSLYLTFWKDNILHSNGLSHWAQSVINRLVSNTRWQQELRCLRPVQTAE